MEVDSILVSRVQSASSGSNNHRIASDLQYYYFAVEIHNYLVENGSVEEITKQKEAVLALEARLRSIVIAHRKEKFQNLAA
jgi:hypothetical protein